jgi:hypothetical protein
MSYRFVDSFRAGPGWNYDQDGTAVPSWSCSKAELYSVQWINSWWWTDELSETCTVSWQNNFVKLLHLVVFITNKFVTMHGHMNVKKTKSRRLVKRYKLRQSVQLLQASRHNETDTRNSKYSWPVQVHSFNLSDHHALKCQHNRHRLSHRFRHFLSAIIRDCFYRLKLRPSN